MFGAELEKFGKSGAQSRMTTRGRSQNSVQWQPIRGCRKIWSTRAEGQWPAVIRGETKRPESRLCVARTLYFGIEPGHMALIALLNVTHQKVACDLLRQQHSAFPVARFGSRLACSNSEAKQVPPGCEKLDLCRWRRCGAGSQDRS